MTDWVDWQKLEEAIPLDDLPDFHRTFLSIVRPGQDWNAAFLRQVQGKVQAALKALEREGRARHEGGRLLVAREVLPEEFRTYVQD